MRQPAHVVRVDGWKRAKEIVEFSGPNPKIQFYPIPAAPPTLSLTYHSKTFDFNSYESYWKLALYLTELEVSEYGWSYEDHYRDL